MPFPATSVTDLQRIDHEGILPGQGNDQILYSTANIRSTTGGMAASSHQVPSTGPTYSQLFLMKIKASQRRCDAKRPFVPKYLNTTKTNYICEYTKEIMPMQSLILLQLWSCSQMILWYSLSRRTRSVTITLFVADSYHGDYAIGGP